MSNNNEIFDKELLLTTLELKSTNSRFFSLFKVAMIFNFSYILMLFFLFKNSGTFPRDGLIIFILAICVIMIFISSKFDNINLIIKELNFFQKCTSPKNIEEVNFEKSKLINLKKDAITSKKKCYSLFHFFFIFSLSSINVIFFGSVLFLN